MSASSPINVLPIDVWILIAEGLSLEDKLNLRQTHRKVAFVAHQEIFSTVCLDPTARTPTYASGTSLYDLPADPAFVHQISKLRHIIEHDMTSLVKTVILTSSEDLSDGSRLDDFFTEAVRSLMFFTHVECISIDNTSGNLCQESFTAAYMFRVLFETIVKSSNNLLEICQLGHYVPIDRLHDLLQEPCTSDYRKAILEGFSKLEHILIANALYAFDQDLMKQASGWRSVLKAASGTLKKIALGIEPDTNWSCPLKFLFPDCTTSYNAVTDLELSSDSNAEELTTIIVSQLPQVRRLSLRNTSLSGSYKAFWKNLQSLQLESLCISQVMFHGLSESISDLNIIDVSDCLGSFLGSQSSLKHLHFAWDASVEPLFLSPELQASWLLETAKSMAIHAGATLRTIFVDFDLEDCMWRQDIDLSPSQTEQYAEHISTICQAPNLQRLTLDTIYMSEVMAYFDTHHDERVEKVFDHEHYPLWKQDSSF